jgi:hypothetical protein
MKGLGALALAVSISAAAAQLGPGRGPWEVSTPEAEGLSSAALRAADEAVESGMGGRVCYLVVKNGKIVHERYMGSGSESSIRSAWSATRVISDCHFAVQLNHFIPGFLSYPVAVFLQ